MWLLDVNLPNGLLGLLEEFQIKSETTASRGWRDLGNGVLARSAVEVGFKVILTRDKLFGESTASTLKKFPELSVVILKIPQTRELEYLKNFRIE